MFAIFDGIDGSGKATLVNWTADMFVQHRKTVVDLRKIMTEEKRFPSPKDWMCVDVVITTEPTYTHAGAALREYLLKNPAYNPLTVAHAFSVDREMHYREIILPALAEGKHILSERGVTSSLAYQVTAGLDEKVIASLPGNALALTHAPNFLIYAQLSAKTAVERLAKRTGKQDNAYFEKQSFLERLAARYDDPTFRSLLTSRGAKWVDVSTEGTLESTKDLHIRTISPLLFP